MGAQFPSRHRWPVDLRCGPVVLRPLRRSDAAQWQQVRLRNAAWNGPWDATVPPGADRVATRFPQMAKAWERQARMGQALPFVICWDDSWPQRETRPRRLPMQGQMTVSNIVGGSAQFASVGYWVDEAIAGRGVMPTALALGVDYCFQVMGLHRIEVNIRPENAKSLRVVEKLGLRDEGVRERYLHIAGDWRDHRSFAVCAEDVPEGLLSRYLAGNPPRWALGG
ncbi:GNAT family N-acetyltransferase [Luteococcus sp. Sow4_B9]|uniref:GNAT family N-acetyltransferase n=1 Tax=Luteococcus sp. Sow4_B9 TaxID=3438792 RepID=UPI003F978BFB